MRTLLGRSGGESGGESRGSARVLRELAEQIQAIESGSGRGPRCRRQPLGTGWAAADQALGQGGLVWGAVHEWFGLVNGQKSGWRPPLCILAHLVQRSLKSVSPLERPDHQWIVWVGKRIWPYPHTLARSSLLLQRSLFVDPPDATTRLWAIDLALRSRGVCTVVADGSRFHMAATRRLQLAAESVATLGLIARPPTEQAQLSAAATRWRVHCEPTASANPRWRIELLRVKGSDGAMKRWSDKGVKREEMESGALPSSLRRFVAPSLLLELSHATDVVAVPADVAGGPDSPATSEAESKLRTA